METLPQTGAVDKNRQIQEANAALEEATLQRIAFAFMEENIAHVERDPHEVIKELVTSLPESPKIINRAEMESFLANIRLSNGDQSVFDHGEVTPLESYLMFLLMTKSPTSTHLERSEETRGDSFSIADSARILRDQVRTKRFLEGVAASIATIKATKKIDEKITVCDAGCGAIPILGLYAALEDDSVHVTCIENNPSAALIATTFVEILGLSDRMTVVTGDARTIVLPQLLDMLVSETMDVGLLNEPMVDIMRHLAPLVQSGGVIIPSQVDVLAVVVPVSSYTEASHYSLIDTDVSPVITAEWSVLRSYQSGDHSTAISGDITLPRTDENVIVLVSTRVVVTPTTPILDSDQSRLTQIMPVPLSRDGRMTVFNSDSTKSQVHISYNAGGSAAEVKIS